MHPESLPRALTARWLALLAAPVAWAAALGALFSLVDEVCVAANRSPQWAVLAAAIVLALAPVPFAWRRARTPHDGHRSSDRACFLARLAIGLSIMFALVIVLSAVPVAMLSACRT